MPKHFYHSKIFLQVFDYITSLLTRQMPSYLFFHTFQHTLDVIKASKEIVLQCNVSSAEREIVLVAACFHDTGYCHIYTGHEEESKKIALQYLRKINYQEDKIAQILKCIEATKLPQQPQSLIEQVLCDADMYHLSSSDYKEKEALLRKEWEYVFNKTYTDYEWDTKNLDFLLAHHYFTRYCKDILEPKKRMHVIELQKKTNQIEKN